MKGMGKLLAGFAIGTFVLLLYVHERVEIFRVSYRIQKKSVELTERGEEFRRLRFEVSELRSPQNLEARLQELPQPLALPQEIQVLRVPTLTPPAELKPLPIHSPSNNFRDFFGQWIQVAQARTEQ